MALIEKWYKFLGIGGHTGVLLTQQTFIGLQDMSSRRLQDVFSVTIFRLPRRFQEVLRDVFKTSWKTRNYYVEEVLKTSSRHVLKTS